MNNFDFEEHPLLFAARLPARICCRLSLIPDPSPCPPRARRFIENKRLLPPGESDLFAIVISFSLRSQCLDFSVQPLWLGWVIL